MARNRVVLVAALIFLACGNVRIATAQTAPVADPGFAYVDVDGDLLYSPAVDIGLGSATSVDINSLIQTGSFNTQTNKGSYRAPTVPVSLVVPASQSFTLPVPLSLKAGLHMVVHGSLSAPSICLKAGSTVPQTFNSQGVGKAINKPNGIGIMCTGAADGSGIADLSSALCLFDTSMTVTAGNDIVLNGAVISGSDTSMPGTAYVSKFAATSSNNIYADPDLNNPVNPGQSTFISTGLQVKFCADRDIYVGGAGLTSADPTGTVYLAADYLLQVDNPYLSAGNLITLKSCNTDVVVNSGSITGGNLTVCVPGNATLGGAYIATAGATTISACGNVLMNTGLPNALSAGSLSIKGTLGVDASNLFANVMNGTLRITACSGDILINNIFAIAPAGFSATAGCSLSAQGAAILADVYTKLTANGGTINAEGSMISAFSEPTPTTYALIQATDNISVGPLNGYASDWTAPAKITVKSSCGNIFAEQVQFHTPKSYLTAYGLQIDVTGAVFDGTASFGPCGVQVTGP